MNYREIWSRILENKEEKTEGMADLFDPENKMEQSEIKFAFWNDFFYTKCRYKLAGGIKNER